MKGKYELIEAAAGKPMAKLLIEAHTKAGSQRGVCEALGISQNTLANWLLIANLEYDYATGRYKQREVQP